MLKRRALFSLLLAGALAAGAFTLGAAYIFMSSLQVSNRFEVHGQQNVLPGHSAHFRALAYSNNPPAALKGATLTMVWGDGEEGPTTREQIDGSGEATLILEVPEELEPGEHEIHASLALRGERLDEASFKVTVPEPGEGTVAPSDLEVVAVASEDPLQVELFAFGGAAIPYLQNTVFVRVTDTESGAPVVATVSVENTYGTLQNAPKSQVKTDSLGLATLSLMPISDTDWEFSAVAPDGRTGTNKRTLLTAPTSIITTTDRYLLNAGQALRVAVQTVRDGGPLYIDVIASGAWIESYRKRLSGDSVTLRWLPRGVGAPPETMVVTAVACFSAISCDGGNARLPLVWSKTALNDRAIAAYLAAEVEKQGRDLEWLGHVQRRLDGEAQAQALDKAELDRLNDALAARISTVYQRPEALVRSEELANTRLDALKAKLKSIFNLLFLLLMLATGLFIGVTAMRWSSERRSALLDFELDDDVALDEHGNPLPEEDEDLLIMAQKARRERIGVAMDVTVLALTIIVFAGGIFLLFQKF